VESQRPTQPSGIAELVQQLDRAVELGDVYRTTAAVKRALSDLIRAGRIELPERYFAPLPHTYARRLLHRDDERGYNAIIMTWGPGQGTPLHDHGGIWCVEGVVSGEMSVVQYELVDPEEAEPKAARGGLCRFVQRGRVHALKGASGALIPPFEYHTLCNALPDHVSVTLHVYGGEMQRCHVFEPTADGAFRRVEKHLVLND
jgi:predicted metal-dependent enzyme (double-stranded beta helix superfamily)